MFYFVIKTLLSIYDIFTFPFYYLIQQPWKQFDRIEEVRSNKIINCPPISANSHCDLSEKYNKIKFTKNDDEMIYTNTHDLLEENNFNKTFATLDKFVAHVFEKYKNRRCLGIREKLTVNNYTWFTYSDIEKRIKNITNGLLEMGIKHNEKVIIFAETRMEWFLIFQSFIRLGATVCTLYSNLGEEGVIDGINSLDSTCIVTTSKLYGKLIKISAKLNNIKTIINLDNSINDQINNNLKELEEMQTITLDEVELKGQLSKINKLNEIKPEDIAVIMFTSGSTGKPKGVMISHKNFLFSLSTLHQLFSDAKFTEKDQYIAYLPLAHIFEMIAETLIISFGVSVGYSTPLTLFDFSPGFAGNPKAIGDVKLVKPTIMCMVPLIMDSVKKIEEMRLSKTSFAPLVNLLIEYKNIWLAKGFRTPILDYFLCKKEAFGNKLKYVICGSAPLNPKTHAFMKAVLDVHVIQAYGATEVIGAAAAMDFFDHSFGKNGAPIHNLYIKLASWKEGNYTVHDRPNPRGEISIGGDSVAMGYYNNPEETKNSFYERDGIRWFKTGDIGEIYSDGTLKILDRVKDIVKLQNGEFVSIGKIENILRSSKFVNNICVVANSNFNHLIALIQPVKKLVEQIAASLQIPNTTSYENICLNKDVIELVLKSLTDLATANGLSKREIPKTIKLCYDEWSPENGLLTAAMKIRRREIISFYQSYVNQMFTD